MGDKIIPCILLLLCLTALWRKKDLYTAFLQGAKQGLKTIWNIFPSLLAMMLAIDMLTSSGLLMAFCNLLTPFFQALGVPPDVFPLMLLRPFSGSGCLAMLEKLFTSVGPDSRAARCACIMMGSSETIFYTLNVYLCNTSIKKTRYCIPCAILSWLSGCIAACLLTS